MNNNNNNNNNNARKLPLKILEWEPEETRRRGRPKERDG
jgi:hypothetical protein